MEIRDTYSLSLINIALQARIDKFNAILLLKDENIKLSPDQEKEYHRIIEIQNQANAEIKRNIQN